MSSSDQEDGGLDLSQHRTVDVAAQFPDALTSAELEQVTHRIERVLGSIEEIRRYPLGNADEPASLFHPIGKEQP
jgi:hypothetical protein